MGVRADRRANGAGRSLGRVQMGRMATYLRTRVASNKNGLCNDGHAAMYLTCEYMLGIRVFVCLMRACADQTLASHNAPLRMASTFATLAVVRFVVGQARAAPHSRYDSDAMCIRQRHKSNMARVPT
jgi:hypothetical protein